MVSCWHWTNRAYVGIVAWCCVLEFESVIACLGVRCTLRSHLRAHSCAVQINTLRSGLILILVEYMERYCAVLALDEQAVRWYWCMLVLVHAAFNLSNARCFCLVFDTLIAIARSCDVRTIQLQWR